MKRLLSFALVLLGLVGAAGAQTIQDVRKAATAATAKSDAAEARVRPTPVATPAPASADELRALATAITAAADDPTKAPLIRTINFYVGRPNVVLSSTQARSFVKMLERKPPPAAAPARRAPAPAAKR